MLEFPRVPFLVLHRLLLLYINDLPDDVICDIYVNDTTLYSKCDEASDQNWTWMWSMRHCGLGQEVAC